MDKKLLLHALENAESLSSLLETIYKSCDAEEHPAQSIMLYGLMSHANGLLSVIASMVLEQNRVEYTSQGE